MKLYTLFTTTMRAILLQHTQFSSDGSWEVTPILSGFCAVGYGPYLASESCSRRPYPSVLDIEYSAIYYTCDGEQHVPITISVNPTFCGRRIRVSLEYDRLMIYWLHGPYTLNYDSITVEYDRNTIDFGYDGSRFDLTITDVQSTAGGTVVTAISAQITTTILLISKL
jgi:hypothetical protein